MRLIQSFHRLWAPYYDNKKLYPPDHATWHFSLGCKKKSFLLNLAPALAEVITRNLLKGDLFCIINFPCVGIFRSTFLPGLFGHLSLRVSVSWEKAMKYTLRITRHSSSLEESWKLPFHSLIEQQMHSPSRKHKKLSKESWARGSSNVALDVGEHNREL